MSAKCKRCGRPLTDPLSIAIGMGPDCRGELGRKGWKFPKPVWKTKGGRVELVGVLGKVERPTVDTDAIAVNKKVKHGKKNDSS